MGMTYLAALERLFHEAAIHATRLTAITRVANAQSDDLKKLHLLARIVIVDRQKLLIDHSRLIDRGGGAVFNIGDQARRRVHEHAAKVLELSRGRSIDRSSKLEDFLTKAGELRLIHGLARRDVSA